MRMLNARQCVCVGGKKQKYLNLVPGYLWGLDPMLVPGPVCLLGLDGRWDLGPNSQNSVPLCNLLYNATVEHTFENGTLVQILMRQCPSVFTF